MLTKTQKIDFVKEHKKALKDYKVVGIVQLKGVPDSLLQSTKNQLRASTRFIIGRKTLLHMVLESNENTKKLANDLTDTSAIILSNEDPFVLYGKFSSNSIRLAAKPGQVSPEDVSVQEGETGIQPGQTVTDLKTAGIDVQIQKGKVVIAKDKILVKKGDLITPMVAKALHTLEIYPFSAVVDPILMADKQMLYTRTVLGISPEVVIMEMTNAFRSALALSPDRNIVNRYTITNLIGKAYNNAMWLGTEANLYDSGVIERVLAKAALGAQSVKGMVKSE